MPDPVGTLQRSALLWVGGRFAFSGLAMLALNLLVMGFYPVADVGALAVLLIVVGVFQLLSDLGVSAACVQRRTQLDDRSASQLVWLLVVGWSGAWLLAAGLAWLFDGNRLTWLLLACAVCIPLLTLRQLSVFSVEARLRFAPTALVEFIETIVLVSVTLVFAWLGWGIWGFVVAFLAKCLTGWMLTSRLRDFRLIAVLPAAPAEFRDLAIFGLHYQTPAIITAARALAMPTALGLLIGLSAVALVDRAIFIAGAPLLLLGAVQNRILFPYFSAHRADSLRVRQAYERALSISALVDKPFFIAIALLVGPLTVQFLMPDYHGLQNLVWWILVPNICLGAFAFASLPAMNGLGRTRTVAALNLVSGAASWLLLWPLVVYLGIWGAVVINLLLWANVVVMFVVMRRLMPGVTIFRATIPSILACAIALGIGLFYYRWLGSEDLKSSIGATIVAWIAYAFFVWLLGGMRGVISSATVPMEPSATIPMEQGRTPQENIRRINRSWPLGAVIAAILLHGMFGRTFPGQIEWQEVLIGGLLLMGLIGAWFTTVESDKLGIATKSGGIWGWSVFLVAATIAMGAITGFLADNPSRQFVRDLVAAGFLFIPLFAWRALRSASPTTFSWLCLALELAGAILALRVFHQVGFLNRAPTIWLSLSEMGGGISSDPLIIFSACAATVNLFLRSTENKSSSYAYLLHAFCLVCCGAIILLMAQRHALFILLLFLVGTPLLGALRGILSLRGSAVAVVCTILLYLHATVPLVGSGKETVSLATQMLLKNHQEGVSAKIREAHAVWEVVSSGNTTLMYGAGLGATYQNPVLSNRQVGFTHALPTYLLLKFGIIGCCALVACALLLLAHSKITWVTAPMVLVVGASCSVGLLTQATHKTLPFALLLALGAGLIAKSWPCATVVRSK